MELTVNDFERLLAQALSEGKNMNDVLKLLFEDGTHVDVEVKNAASGRATKNSASLDSWKRKDGEIVLRFKRTKKPVGRPRLTNTTDTHGQIQERMSVVSIDDQIMNALELLHQRQKRPFYGWKWFKRQLPLLGIDLPERELDVILEQMVTQGKLIREQLPVPEGWNNAENRHPTGTVRTANMPPPQNWYKEPR